MSHEQSAPVPWQQLSVKAGVIEVKKSGMVFSGKLALRDWESIGECLNSMADSATWWIADWLLFGESAYMERYEEAIRRTSLSYQTLRNYAWVARRFELSRRRDNLSFGHHAEVAALSLPEQEFWLRKTEESDWSRNRLRAEVRRSLRECRSDSSNEDPEQAKAVQAGSVDSNPAVTLHGQVKGDVRHEQIAMGLTLRLKDDVFAKCVAVAQRHGLCVDEWAVGVLIKTALLHGSYSNKVFRVGEERAAAGTRAVVDEAPGTGVEAAPAGS
jgi:hypothetical protein